MRKSRAILFPALVLTLAWAGAGRATEVTQSGLSFPPVFQESRSGETSEITRTVLLEPVADSQVTSPSDEETQSANAAPAGGSSCASCSSGCWSGRCAHGCGCDLGQPYSLFKNCWLSECMGIKVGGWIQQGYTTNVGQPSDGFNGPVALNDVDDGYQLNQAWLYLDRQAVTDGCGTNWGGHVDVLYGTDWRFGINNGLEDRMASIGNEYGPVIPQAYFDVAWNRLTVRMGHYAGLLSYEQVPSVLNFFYSHSYTMGYAEPLLVTGANANYKLTDRLSMDGGFHRGAMQWEDNNNELDFMGGFTWVSDSKATKFRFMVDAGPQDDAGLEDQFIYSLIWEQTFTKRLRYALQSVYGFTNNSGLNNGDDAEFYSLVNYLYYQINPCWSAGMRMEWFRDDDGTRVAGVGSIGRYGWDSPPGFAGDFGALSLGLNWRPHANVLIRPEARWDWYNGLDNARTGLRPFDGGTQDEQFLLAADLIVTF
ncbi:MAG: outer membrane beta-barrel protein [Thermoguttaceae bacterium]